jgi:hypothetical protein
MKTITRKLTNISLYILPDSTTVIIGDEQTQVGADPVEFFIADCSTSNAVLHENVPEPTDWVTWKYFFDGTEWTLNPDWIDPRPAKE